MNTSDLILPSWDYENPPHFHPLFQFETMDYKKWRYFMAHNWKFSFYSCSFYLLIIFSIQKYMRHRQPLKLQRALVLWNIALGLFSIFGFYRVAPELLRILMEPNGFHRSLCIREGLNKPSATFALLFAFSKYIEFGDSVFIVLRKQPLIFLQWYHHCAALILAWLVVPYAEPITRYYGSMNYAVHGLMYPYFSLKAMKISIPRKISMLITSLQLLQMIIGVLINLYTLYVMYIGLPCARDPQSVKWIAGIYFSFMVLFANFMYKSYFGGGSGGHVKKI